MDYDVVIIGGGAAGLMCAQVAGRRGRRVRVIEHANRVGKKILMSGGGRCNFTNLHTTPANFISRNPHFCKSALARYTQHDFISMVDRHGIAWHEKELGQLFCDDYSKQIVQMLLDECVDAGVEITVNCEVTRVAQAAAGFVLETAGEGSISAHSLVIASGGLSIPKMGATGLGYELARQFGHGIVPTRAALVPLTLTGRHLENLQDLSGVALPVESHCNGEQFRAGMLFTHRGISGPAILQISSYWQPGDDLRINLVPDILASESTRQPVSEKNMDPGLRRGDGDNLSSSSHSGDSKACPGAGRGRDPFFAYLKKQQNIRPATEFKTLLGEIIPKRLAQKLCEISLGSKPIRQYSLAELRDISEQLQSWPIVACGTEGYRTAEVTLGGVDTDELSSTTMESKRVRGLYFIGEVVDVTGHLGGYNFQWAWASGHAAGQAV